MGTKNTTKVICHGLTMVAQYGQWDGYPSGTGIDVLSFLKNIDLSIFKKMVLKCSPLNKEEIKELNGLIASKELTLPKEYNRDTGSNILDIIYKGDCRNNKLLIHSGNEEWNYTIDLDRRELIVVGYTEFIFDLGDLPTEELFLKILEEDDE